MVKTARLHLIFSFRFWVTTIFFPSHTYLVWLLSMRYLAKHLSISQMNEISQFLSLSFLLTSSKTSKRLRVKDCTWPAGSSNLSFSYHFQPYTSVPFYWISLILSASPKCSLFRLSFEPVYQVQMKDLVVCNSLDRFLSGVTRRHFVLSIHRADTSHNTHRKGKKKRPKSWWKKGKGREQDSRADVHTRCTANSSTCSALTN